MATFGKETFENARIIFKNFSGKETEYNPAGSRNFCLVLDDDDAERLSALGWNVKTKEPREGREDEGPLHFLKVSLSYKFEERAPKIWRLNGKRKTQLTEATVGSLDWDEIETIDLRIRPWNWERAGRKGVSAFLDTMYVTVREDNLAKKYDFDDGDPIAEEEPIF